MLKVILSILQAILPIIIKLFFDNNKSDAPECPPCTPDESPQPQPAPVPQKKKKMWPWRRADR